VCARCFSCTCRSIARYKRILVPLPSGNPDRLLTYHASRARVGSTINIHVCWAGDRLDDLQSGCHESSDALRSVNDSECPQTIEVPVPIRKIGTRNLHSRHRSLRVRVPHLQCWRLSVSVPAPKGPACFSAKNWLDHQLLFVLFRFPPWKPSRAGLFVGPLAFHQWPYCHGGQLYCTGLK